MPLKINVQSYQVMTRNFKEPNLKGFTLQARTVYVDAVKASFL